jgi:hypothetical protein
LNQQQLQIARAALWHQTAATDPSAPLVTFDDAARWLDDIGLCLFLPRHTQLPAPAPSFVEACAGAPSVTPPPAAIAHATELAARLIADRRVIPLNLLGAFSEQADFLVTPEVLPWTAAVRGDRQWKTAPGGRTAPIVLRTWEALDREGEMTAVAIRELLGRELTEAAVLRALIELWTTLRAMPLQSPGEPTRWTLLKNRFPAQLATAANTAQTTALSALLSLYLHSAVAATAEEAEIFLSPLTARSRIRDVLHGMMASRQFGTTTVASQTLLFIEGSLPEAPEPEPQPAAAPTPPPPAPRAPSRKVPRPTRWELPARDARPPWQKKPAAADRPAPASNRPAANRPRREGKPFSSQRPAGPRPFTASRPAPFRGPQRPASRPSPRPASRPGPQPVPRAGSGSRPENRPGAKPWQRRGPGSFQKFRKPDGGARTGRPQGEFRGPKPQGEFRGPRPQGAGRPTRPPQPWRGKNSAPPQSRQNRPWQKDRPQRDKPPFRDKFHPERPQPTERTAENRPPRAASPRGASPRRESPRSDRKFGAKPRFTGARPAGRGKSWPGKPGPGPSRSADSSRPFRPGKFSAGKPSRPAARGPRPARPGKPQNKFRKFTPGERNPRKNRKQEENPE